MVGKVRLTICSSFTSFYPFGLLGPPSEPNRDKASTNSSLGEGINPYHRESNHSPPTAAKHKQLQLARAQQLNSGLSHQVSHHVGKTEKGGNVTDTADLINTFILSCLPG